MLLLSPGGVPTGGAAWVPTAAPRRAAGSPTRTACRPRLCIAASGSASRPPDGLEVQPCRRRELLLAAAGATAAAALPAACPAYASPGGAAPLAGSQAAAGLAPLVDVEWLRQHLGSVTLLDAAWQPGAPGAGAAAFQQERIPGARFLDLEGIADPAASPGLPLMLPRAAAFGAAAGALGVGERDAVVVYDGRGQFGAFTAPRAWWMWRVMGHSRVAVLDGGLPAWKAAGGRVDAGPLSPGRMAAPTAAVQHAYERPLLQPSYQARLQADQVRDWQDMMRTIGSGSEQIVDARSPDWYLGHQPARPGIRAGHMPGAVSLPAASLLAGGRYLPPAELRARFAAAGLDLGRPMVAYCTTGIQAATVALAARLAAPGARCAVYDGSWSEWGSLPGVPVVGPAPGKDGQPWIEPIKRLA